MKDEIKLLQRLSFAGMWLRLTDTGGLLLGPGALVRTHWHLRQEITVYKTELLALMCDLHVCHMFSDDAEVTEGLSQLVTTFIADQCEPKKDAVLSGLTLHRTFYPWAFAQGVELPTRAQLYAAMDAQAARAPALDSSRNGGVVMWAGVQLKKVCADAPL